MMIEKYLMFYGQKKQEEIETLNRVSSYYIYLLK